MKSSIAASPRLLTVVKVKGAAVNPSPIVPPSDVNSGHVPSVWSCVAVAPAVCIGIGASIRHATDAISKNRKEKKTIQSPFFSMFYA